MTAMYDDEPTIDNDPRTKCPVCGAWEYPEDVDRDADGEVSACPECCQDDACPKHGRVSRRRPLLDIYDEIDGYWVKRVGWLRRRVAYGGKKGRSARRKLGTVLF
jgi:hypothetical protein